MTDNEINTQTECCKQGIKLTEEEIALLFDYRLANEEQRKKIREFVENFNK